jgi:hypothetical protein
MSVLTIGNIAMSFVSPDVLQMKWKASFGEAEADGLLAYTHELKARPDVKHLLLCIDVREAGSIDARARKKISELTKEKPYLASAIIGASFPIRVAVELIVNAARLLVKDSAETRFFDDDASANAWLAEVRATAAQTP